MGEAGVAHRCCFNARDAVEIGNDVPDIEKGEKRGRGEVSIVPMRDDRPPQPQLWDPATYCNYTVIRYLPGQRRGRGPWPPFVLRSQYFAFPIGLDSWRAGSVVPILRAKPSTMTSSSSPHGCTSYSVIRCWSTTLSRKQELRWH